MRIALQGLLISCNQMSAEYLFMQDKLYDVQYDTGDKVIQCGRHNDVFKLWLQWRAKVSAVPIFGFCISRSSNLYLPRPLTPSGPDAVIVSCTLYFIRVFFFNNIRPSCRFPCPGHRRFRKTHGPFDGAERVHGGQNQGVARQILLARRTGNGERQLLVRAETLAQRPTLAETSGNPWTGESDKSDTTARVSFAPKSVFWQPSLKAGWEIIWTFTMPLPSSWVVGSVLLTLKIKKFENFNLQIILFNSVYLNRCFVEPKCSAR